MIRCVTLLTILLLGLTVLAACSPSAPYWALPTPTVYYAPATPAVYIPPELLPDGQVQPEATTVLLMGIDRRGQSGRTNNTDAMMLFRLDPQGQVIAILSVPRDLYVEIPGHGQGRINTGYAWGKRDGTGGLALARQTVSAALGVPVEHAVLIDFQVFVTLIDAIGGVDVDAPYGISDPTYPDGGIGYDPFYLSAGHHHLDGATALKYARTRATPGGDFTRTVRQRQIVVAARDRVMNLNLLPDLIAQSPQLWSTLQGAFETDLTLGEIVGLVVAASRIPADQIKTASIDETCTQPWVTPGGAAVLIPLQDKINALVTDLFSLPQTAASTP
jgi:LCP family protein required for cell wall assembly